MVSAAPVAMFLVLKLVICALISFAGAFLILSSWFDRKISGVEALLLALGLLIVEFIGVSLSFHGESGIWFLLLIVSGVPALFWGLARRADRRLRDSMVAEDIASYQAAIDFDPKNVAAHSLLADTYRHMEELERAIEEYRAALALDPTLKPERYWVQRLEAELERRASKEMRCPRCGAVRPAAASVCPECSRWYSTIETAAHTMRTMTPKRKAAWSAGLTLGLIALLAAVNLAPGAVRVAAALLLFAAPIAVIFLMGRAGRGATRNK